VAAFAYMSTQEIMAELTKLSRADLEQLDERLHELLRQDTKPSSKNWADALSELAGTAEGLPEDFAQHHATVFTGLQRDDGCICGHRLLSGTAEPIGPVAPHGPRSEPD
jgi:hypothetical protein